MPEEEIGEGVSKAAKENLALTKKFKGLKMSEGQQQVFKELVDTREEGEDFETFLDSPLVESIKKDLSESELNEQVDRAIEEKEEEREGGTARWFGWFGPETTDTNDIDANAMQRAIESLNIGRLALEKKKLAQYIEEAEDEEEVN